MARFAGALGITTVLKVQLAANGVAIAAEMTPLVIEGHGVPEPDPKARAIQIVRDLSRQLNLSAKASERRFGGGDLGPEDSG